MPCAGQVEFSLSECSGEVQKIKDLAKQVKSKVLCFADGLLTHESELCMLHLQTIGRDCKTTCSDPFGNHSKSIVTGPLRGKKFKKVMENKPGLIEPNETLCRPCFEAALVTVATVPNVSDQSDSNMSEEEEENESRFSLTNLRVLNEILSKLGLSELEYGRRNEAGKIAMINTAAKEVTAAILALFDIPVKENTKSDLLSVIDDIKEKTRNSSYNDKIKIASMFSGALSLRKISESFNISDNAARIAANLHKTAPILAEPQRKRRKGLSDHVVDKVLNFYDSDEFTRTLPNVKDVRKMTNPDGTETFVARRLLLCSISELYANFRKQFPGAEFKIGRSRFADLRPSHVLLLQHAHHEGCLCIYHENIRLLYSSVGIHDYNEFTSTLVCNKDSKTCMFRRCTDCKDDVKKHAFTQKLRENILRHHPKYEEMDITYKEWSNSSRDLVVTCSLSLEDFLVHVFERTSTFLKHKYIAQIQSRKFKEMKANVDGKTAIIQCDFAENYSPVYDREVQKAFFVKQMTTIHPFVITLLDDGKPTTVSAVVVSDEMQHNTNTYYAFQKTLLTWLLSKYPHLENVVYWSDGAGSQYKNFKNGANLKHHKRDFTLQASHHFFASCHGKGSCDATGGVVKCKVRRAASAGAIIQAPREFFNYISEHVKGVTSFFITSNEVKKIVDDAKLEERYASSQKIPHIRELHRLQVTADAMYLYETSDDNEPCATILCAEEFHGSDVSIGEWVACIYDDNWYYGQVRKVLPELQELKVHFLRGPGDSTITFSNFENKPIYIPWCRVLTKVAAPSKPNSRTFTFDNESKDKAMHKFELLN